MSKRSRKSQKTQSAEKQRTKGVPFKKIGLVVGAGIAALVAVTYAHTDKKYDSAPQAAPRTKNDVSVTYDTAKRIPEYRQIYLSQILTDRQRIGTPSWQYVSGFVYDPLGKLAESSCPKMAADLENHFQERGVTALAVTPVLYDYLVPSSPVHVMNAAFLDKITEDEFLSLMDHEAEHARFRAQGVQIRTCEGFRPQELSERFEWTIEEMLAYDY